jgi:hypothetical protein
VHGVFKILQLARHSSQIPSYLKKAWLKVNQGLAQSNIFNTPYAIGRRVLL